MMVVFPQPFWPTIKVRGVSNFITSLRVGSKERILEFRREESAACTGCIEGSLEEGLGQAARIRVWGKLRRTLRWRVY
jgi:hypothetical protein